MIMFFIVGCMVGTVLSLPFISNSAPVNPLQISIGPNSAGAEKVAASTAR
ncbi:hypothetical protein MRS76_20040 [Rhizobiaceae bacterium n13]|uniref:Uncharacterized protein n=1 Tax=Ferirhizobium litorale TaxID=2927786 RepID=A0AAE3QJL9_9HYPH|nr:hypothetical protein [Fererhizobium litorale]MDI7864232.1 hypothetical protein [Fererhizobium litorale]MDI7925125.1 hypothetical protein [Fererhizobium litorale]